MIRLAQIYTGQGNFVEMLEKNGFDKGSECLVKLFTSVLDQETALRAAQEIKAILPRAKIIGASSAGIVYNGEQYEESTMVLVERYDHLQFTTAAFTWEGKTAWQVAEEVHSAFCHAGKNLVHILFSDRYYDVTAFVNEINKLSPLLHLAGGIAGDILGTGMPGFVFTDEGLVKNGAVAYAVTGEEAHTFLGVNVSQEPISPPFTITKMDGGVIEEIENEPADRWMFRYLGIEEMRSFQGWKEIANNDRLIHFQVLLEDHSNAGRFTRYDTERKKLTLYFSRLPAGTRFQIGYTSSTKCVQECYDICQNIMNRPVEYLFTYACLFRKLYLENCAKWELKPFEEYNVCGLFMMGEIGFLGGQNEFFNGACLLTGVAEKETYVFPDFRVFGDLYQIQDDSDLLSFALSRQKETISNQNKELMARLLKQSETMRQQMYSDPSIGLPNVLQYRVDKQKFNYDKMCLVQVENSEMLIAIAGQEKYLETVRDIVTKTAVYIKERCYDEDLMLYAFNQSVLFYTGKETTSEKHFRRIIEDLHDNFQFAKSEKTGLSLTSRYVLVLGQKDMLESGFNTLQANKDVQTHFLVCDSKSKLNFSYADELRIIELLNRVIENGGVKPYYQGIRDNSTGLIEKYEALMRLVDLDGKIYLPSVFMEIAKKYHLYSRLSYQMIEQVFDDFARRSEMVSVNLSVFDINSKEFCEWFYGKLQNFPQRDRLVVEFVETENVKNSPYIADFLKTVRSLGVKIAVDDFGAGYSTLSEIVKLDPDYIKIDGEIVRDLSSNDRNLIILKTIVFLARQLELDVVAEYVEDREIQKIIEDNKIAFSQGYLFSKPAPLEILEEKDK